MDPNAALAELRELIEEHLAVGDRGNAIAERARALDEWLSKGGFLPDAWASARVDPWADDPDYPPSDWFAEVVNGDTRLGYVDWVTEWKRSQA